MITDVDTDIDMDIDIDTDTDMDMDTDTDMNSDIDPDMHCRAGGGGGATAWGGVQPPPAPPPCIRPWLSALFLMLKEKVYGVNLKKFKINAFERIFFHWVYCSMSTLSTVKVLS